MDLVVRCAILSGKRPDSMSQYGCFLWRDRMDFQPKGRLMKNRLLLLTFFACCGSALAQSAVRPVYLDPTKPQEQRIADLVGRLTLEEKAAQLNHLNTGVPRLNIPMWGGWN